MKYYVTIERTLTRGYEINAANDDEAAEKAEALRAEVMNDPDQMEDSGESWDHAVSDEQGRDIVTWSNC